MKRIPPATTTHPKLLASDLLSQTPASFIRRAAPVSRAEILGVVTSRELKPDRFLKFAVDDGTGCVPCVLWLNQISSPYFSRRDPRLLADVAERFASEVGLGLLARVRGRVTEYRGGVQLTVSDVAIERDDPNAEILHWLDCLRLARSS